MRGTSTGCAGCCSTSTRRTTAGRGALLTRSFTPRAVAELTEAIEATADMLVDRMVAGAPEGRCDVAKDVAADLPLLTLAEVLGVPAEDRYLCSTGRTG